MDVRVQLLRRQVSDDLTELHTVAFVDEDVADASDQIEPQLHLAATLDGRAPEHLSHDVAAIARVTARTHRRDEAVTRHQHDQEDQRKELQPAEMTTEAGAERARRAGRR